MKQFFTSIFLTTILSVNYCYGQTKKHIQLGFFVSPVIYQIENSDNFINEINNNYVIVNTNKTLSSEFGFYFQKSIKKLNLGVGFSMKNYSISSDIGFTTSEIDKSNQVNNFFIIRKKEVRMNSFGTQIFIGINTLKNTQIRFVLNYYRAYSMYENILPSGNETKTSTSLGFSATYKERLISFSRTNLIPELNFTTKIQDGFYINYGVKSKFFKREYFSAELIGKTNTSANEEVLLDMSVFSRHTSLYFGIGYILDNSKFK
jgi:hypothetical protein